MQTLPKWLVNGLGALLIALVGLLVMDKSQNLSNKFSGKTPDNTLTVSAEGKVKAVPDLATITLGVVSQGADAGAVQDLNSKKLNKIIDFVKQQGVGKEDISTSQFNIYPQYNYTAGKNEIVGYEARQTITIKVKGVEQSTEKLGKIISGATGNGANEISGVSLSFDDPDNLRQQARQQAIEKAKAKAKELAQSAGLNLGRVVSVSESNSNTPFPMYDSYGRGAGGGGYEAGGAASPNIEPGNQEVIEQMSVTFELK